MNISPALLAAALALPLLACRASPSPARSHVVFVCEHGAAKSVVAAAYFNQLAAERGLVMRAIARGADPQALPSRSAVEGLRGDGLPSPEGPPRPLAAAELRGAAHVVVFDCGQPGMKALRAMDRCWDDVPATGDGYARARDIIRAHVTQMLDELSDGQAGTTAR